MYFMENIGSTMLQLPHFQGRVRAPNDHTQSRGLLFANTAMPCANVLMHSENPGQALASGYLRHHHNEHPAAAAIQAGPVRLGHLQITPPPSELRAHPHL